MFDGNLTGEVIVNENVTRSVEEQTEDSKKKEEKDRHRERLDLIFIRSSGSLRANAAAIGVRAYQ